MRHVVLEEESPSKIGDSEYEKQEKWNDECELDERDARLARWVSPSVPLKTKPLPQ